MFALRLSSVSHPSLGWFVLGCDSAQPDSWISRGVPQSWTSVRAQSPVSNMADAEKKKKSVWRSLASIGNVAAS